MKILVLKKDYFEQLSAAIIKNSPVNFIYSNKLRVVNPYKLINNNSIWYLLADENNQLKKTSHFQKKIEKFNWKDETKNLILKKIFLEQIEKNDTNWFSNESIEVILKINNKKRVFLKKRDFTK